MRPRRQGRDTSPASPLPYVLWFRNGPLIPLLLLADLRKASYLDSLESSTSLRAFCGGRFLDLAPHYLLSAAREFE